MLPTWYLPIIHAPHPFPLPTTNQPIQPYFLKADHLVCSPFVAHSPATVGHSPCRLSPPSAHTPHFPLRFLPIILSHTHSRCRSQTGQTTLLPLKANRPLRAPLCSTRSGNSRPHPCGLSWSFTPNLTAPLHFPSIEPRTVRAALIAFPRDHISADCRCSHLLPLAALASHFARLVRKTRPVPPGFLPPALNSSSSVPHGSPVRPYAIRLGVRPSAPPRSTAIDKAGRRSLSFQSYQPHYAPFGSDHQPYLPPPIPAADHRPAKQPCSLQDCPSALRSPCSAPSAFIGRTHFPLRSLSGDRLSPFPPSFVSCRCAPSLLHRLPTIISSPRPARR